MNVLTANELKTKGISAVEACLQVADEAIISVRGKDKYIVMDMKKYNAFREYELEMALQEAKADIDTGQFVKETAQQHIKRMNDEL
jgi:hypothetical protein